MIDDLWRLSRWIERYLPLGHEMLLLITGTQLCVSSQLITTINDMVVAVIGHQSQSCMEIGDT